MKQLAREATIEIDMTDLAAILTEVFCDKYTPFAGLYVENVRKLEEDEHTFELSLSVKATEATNGNEA